MSAEFPVMNWIYADAFNAGLKVVVFLFVFAVWLLMLKKYRIKKTVPAKILTIALFNFALIPLCSALNELVNLKHVFGEYTYVGTGFAFIFHGFANIYYFYFVADIYLTDRISPLKMKGLIGIVAAVEIIAPVSHLITKIAGSPVYLVFLEIHMITSILIYVVVLYFSVKLMRRVPEGDAATRIRHILNSAVFSLICSILFILDTLYVGVTYYGIIGWLFFLLSSVEIYRAYVM